MNRTFAWQIILRYFRGKGTANAVPLLSRISMVAIAVASCAMIILLSVFNGLGGLIKDLYKAFYPDVRIVAERGKFFSLSAEQMKNIKQIKGIYLIAPTIEDNVLMNNEGQDNRVITVKGVNKDFFAVNDLNPYIKGRKTLSTGGEPVAIVGELIMNQMGMAINQGINSITLHYPNVNNTNPAADPASAFSSLHLKPEGTFKVMDEFDDKYIIAPLQLAQDLLQAPGQYSALEIKLAAGRDADEIKEQIKKITGSAYRVETRYEQNRTLYMVMRTEKWAMYAILVLVLIIASFNMIGALSLLVIEKGKDVAILKAMGAENNAIKSIFLGEGILWTFVGGIAGLVPGLLLCLGQTHFGWIKMEGFIVDAYPVRIILTDILLIICTIILVGFIASWYPSRKAIKTEMPGLKS